MRNGVLREKLLLIAIIQVVLEIVWQHKTESRFYLRYYSRYYGHTKWNHLARDYSMYKTITR